MTDRQKEIIINEVEHYIATNGNGFGFADAIDIDAVFELLDSNELINIKETAELRVFIEKEI